MVSNCDGETTAPYCSLATSFFDTFDSKWRACDDTTHCWAIRNHVQVQTSLKSDRSYPGDASDDRATPIPFQLNRNGSSLFNFNFAAFSSRQPAATAHRIRGRPSLEVMALSHIEGVRQLPLASASMFKRGTGPAPLGSNGTRAGSDIRKRQRWTMRTKPPLADPFQPRLVAGVTCLIVTLEN